MYIISEALVGYLWPLYIVALSVVRLLCSNTWGFRCERLVLFVACRYMKPIRIFSFVNIEFEPKIIARFWLSIWPYVYIFDFYYTIILFHCTYEFEYLHNCSLLSFKTITHF